MPGEKLTLHINCAEVFALAFQNGKQFPSQYGDPETLYTLVDGRIIYAPTPLVEEFNRLGVKAHEPVEVVKRSKLKYEVRRVKAAGPQALEANRALAVPAVGGGINNDKSAPPLRAAEHSNDNTRYSSRSLALMSALKDAIDAAAEADAYLARLDLKYFTPEDIRAMANTLIIQGGSR